MPDNVEIDQLMNDIENLYASAPDSSETLIESYLENRFRSLSPGERLAHLETLVSMSRSEATGADTGNTTQEGSLLRLVSLILGRNVSATDLTSKEFSDRLMESFDLIFDHLNRLIATIDVTLHDGYRGDETIRQVIGAHIEGTTEQNSLESYVDKINQAFLTTHQAFKEAAKSMVSQILEELNPENIASNNSGGIKPGVLKKAECFDLFKDKYRLVEKWFETERFTEKLLREFEKNSRNISEDREE